MRGTLRRDQPALFCFPRISYSLAETDGFLAWPSVASQQASEPRCAFFKLLFFSSGLTVITSSLRHGRCFGSGKLLIYAFLPTERYKWRSFVG